MSVVERTRDRVVAPTEDQPEEGCVRVANVQLLAGVRWEADGAHFIQSTESDVSGSGDSLDEAVDQFVADAFDTVERLASLIAAGEATDYETKIQAMISERIAMIARELDDREQARRRDVLLNRMMDAVRSRSLKSPRGPNKWLPSPLARSRNLSHA